MDRFDASPIIYEKHQSDLARFEHGRHKRLSILASLVAGAGIGYLWATPVTTNVNYQGECELGLNPDESEIIWQKVGNLVSVIIQCCSSLLAAHSE